MCNATTLWINCYSHRRWLHEPFLFPSYFGLLFPQHSAVCAFFFSSYLKIIHEDLFGCDCWILASFLPLSQWHKTIVENIAVCAEQTHNIDKYEWLKRITPKRWWKCDGSNLLNLVMFLYNCAVWKIVHLNCVLLSSWFFLPSCSYNVYGGIARRVHQTLHHQQRAYTALYLGYPLQFLPFAAICMPFSEID